MRHAYDVPARSAATLGSASGCADRRERPPGVSTLDHRLTRPSRTSLLRALDPDARRLLHATIRAAETRRVTLWAVGGALRDCAAGLPVFDLDLALDVSAHADVLAFATAVADATGGHAAAPAPALGTAEVTAAGTVVDVAALRRERYARPGVLPTVTLGAAIEEDLGRRDFSVNAMALALTGPRRGAFVDPERGLDDLAARRLRVLHSRSFADDATRLWRGARTAAQHRLRPDHATASLIAGAAPWLDTISGERLYAEFRHSAHRPHFLATLRLAERWGVLAATAPGFALAPEARRALGAHPAPHPDALAAALVLAPLADPARVLARLRPPRDVRIAVGDAARLLEAARAGVDPADTAALEALVATGALARRAARWLAPADVRPLARALTRWERTRPHLDARALIALGVPPGPELGRALARLRRERYLGNLRTVADARRAAGEEIACARRGRQ